MMRTVALVGLVCLCSCSTVGEKLRSSARAVKEITMPAAAQRDRSNELVREADRFRDSGDVPRAALGYLRALGADPDSQAPRERIGFLQLSRGENELAQASFDSALRRNPGSVLAHTGLGLARLARGDAEGAERALGRAIELDPGALLPLIALGTSLDGRGRHTQAQVYYIRAKALAPESAQIESNMGFSMLMAKDLAGALRHFGRAIRLDPKNEAARNNLGLTYGKLRRYEEALQAFRQAGSEAQALNNLGYLHFMNGEFAEARACYERALAANPEDKRPIIANVMRVEQALGLREAVSATAAEPGSLR